MSDPLVHPVAQRMTGADLPGRRHHPLLWVVAAATVLALPATVLAAHPRAASLSIRTAMISVSGHRTEVFTTAAGRTLYYNKRDTAAKASCTGSCLTYWPALTTRDLRVAGPKGIHGTFSIRSDGNGRQVEFNGHPLYIYSGDHGPRESHGQGVAGVWAVATPSLRASAAKKKTGGGGYGY